MPFSLLEKSGENPEEKKEANCDFSLHSLPDAQGPTKITWLPSWFLLFADTN